MKTKKFKTNQELVTEASLAINVIFKEQYIGIFADYGFIYLEEYYLVNNELVCNTSITSPEIQANFQTKVDKDLIKEQIEWLQKMYNSLIQV